MFDVASRRLRIPEIELTLDAGAVAVGPDGRFVAVSGGRAGRVVVVDTTIGDASSGPAVVELPPVPGAAMIGRVRTTAALAFRPDGMLVAGSPAGVLRVVDPVTGAVVEQLAGAPEGTSDAVVAVAADGAVVTTGSRGVARWDSGSGMPAWVRAVGAGDCERAVVAVIVGAVLCADATGSVVALDLATGSPTGNRYDLQRGPASALLLTPDGTTLLEVGAEEPVIARWRLDGIGLVSRRLPVAGVPLGYSSDGRLLTVQVAETVAVVEAMSGAVVDRLDGYTVPIWTEDPSRLVAWEEHGGTGHVLDVRSHQRVLQLNGGLGEPLRGSALAWGEGEKPETVVTWNVHTGDYAGRVLVRAGDRASITPDGAVIAVGRSAELVLTTRDAQSGAVLAERVGVADFAVSPAGLVAASGSDGRLDFLDPRTLAPLGPPVAGVPSPAEQFAFTADGRLLVARSTDGDVWLVDVSERVLLGGPVEQPGAIEGVAVRPDGAELALHSGEGIVLWDLRPESWTAAACRIAGRQLTPLEWQNHVGSSAHRATCA